MNEKDRLFIFILENKVDVANALMKNIDINNDDTGDKTFGSVRLSVSGQEPVTYYACNTASDEDYKNALFGTSHSPWMDIYLESDGFTFKSSCEDMGLKLIETYIV